jgi:ketosteroid isomerase-like protein
LPRSTASPARLLAIVAAVFIPIASCARAPSPSQADLVAQLAARAEAGNDAFINGDVHRWLEIVGPIAPDFTLMQPLGGVSRGFDPSDAHLDQLARTFTQGIATFELVQSYATSDMAVLVFIERQRAIVAGLPEQDWSLRVTQIYRRNGEAWELVHRHADPIVENIGMQATAALATTG